MGGEDEAKPSKLRFRGTRQKDADFLEENAKKDGVIQLPSGLQYKVLKEVTDKTKPKPKASTPCRCHYRGKLVDGTEFDSSYKRGTPATFQPDQVVRGWFEAMQLMREGEKWELYVPADLGYGERGAPGAIPGGAALIFELEMLEVGVQESGMPSYLYVIILAVVAAGLLFAAYQNFGGPSAVMGPAVTLKEASSPSNPRVWFDIEIGSEAAGRVEFELFSSVTPKTAENFRALSTGETGNGKSGKPLWFKSSAFHRIIPGFMCQGGDITRGNGMGGESIYGSTFEDEWEKGVIKHTEPGLLSMANRGKNTQSSQFFITTQATSWLDNKHVVFGRVVGGMDVVRKMEAQGSGGGSPAKAVRIADSGELKSGGASGAESPSSDAPTPLLEV